LARSVSAGRVLALGAVLIGSLIGAACGSTAERGSAPATTVAPAPVDYAERGPYPVGLTTLRLGDREVAVFYPADEAGTHAIGVVRVTGYRAADVLPASVKALLPAELNPRLPLDAYRDVQVSGEGPFPLVLYSHGFGGYSLDAAQQLEHLASWGFIAAAPEHVERDLLAVGAGPVDITGDPDVRDLRTTLRRMRQENTTQNGMFQAAVDLQHIAAIGHSSGGRAAALVAADPAITTWIGQAPALPLAVAPDAPEPTGDELTSLLAAANPPDKPSMLLAADGDATIPLANVQAEYAWLPAPKRLAVLVNAGHSTFIDACAPIRAEGGLSQFAESLPVPSELLVSAEDGCLPGMLDPGAALRLIDHLQVAQLRHVFGLDDNDASLERAYLDRQFPGTLADYRSQP
jgi:predicted dienelactone hydrolase